jgi:hypothetical protein
MDSNIVTPDLVPEHWVLSDESPHTCTCAEPVRQERAAYKGAARTYCARCDLPVRISFESR